MKLEGPQPDELGNTSWSSDDYQRFVQEQRVHLVLGIRATDALLDHPTVLVGQKSLGHSDNLHGELLTRGHHQKLQWDICLPGLEHGLGS